MAKFIKLPYKLLIYDIETGLLLAWMFALGEQVIRHNQLLECADMFSILTISYKWYGDSKITILEGSDALERFDKVAREADVIIGKNNFRFDDKRLNTDRLLKGLPPFPEWAARSDDLEQQLRRYFAFPSYSLDAISTHLGLGGKEKMEFNDWVDIAKLKLINNFIRVLPKKASHAHIEAFTRTLFKEGHLKVVRKGKLALKKMGHYNGKDVLDTEAILKKVLPYIKLRKNASASTKDGIGCVTCGSLALVPTKIVTVGKTKYQEFRCLDHDGYAGRCTFTWNKTRNKVYGKMA